MKTYLFIIILFLLGSTMIYSQPENDFKIGMFGGLRAKVNPSTGFYYEHAYDGPMKTSSLNVLSSDGFNIVQNYGFPDMWCSPDQMKSIISLVNDNGMQIMTHSKEYYWPQQAPYPLCPTPPCSPSVWCDMNNIVDNEYNCTGPLPRPNYYDLWNSVYNDNQWSNTVWGHQVGEEAEYGSSGAYVDACGTNTMYDKYACPPLEVSDAIREFNSYKSPNSEHQKLILMPAYHSSFMDDAMNTGACFQSKDYLTMDSRPDAVFEGSYFHRQYALYDGWERYYTPNSTMYLGKFKSIDYIISHGYKCHSVLSSYFDKDIDRDGIMIFSFHSNLKRKNANHLWFNAYNSIVHGADGVWFWGLEWMFQTNSDPRMFSQYEIDPYSTSMSPNSFDYSDNTNLNQFEVYNFPVHYRRFVAPLARELRYLVNNGFLDSRASSKIYTKTTVKGCIVDDAQNYIPSMVPADDAEDVLTSQVAPYTLQSLTSFSNIHRTEPYGLRYSIRTNGTDVIMIVTNPNPIPLKDVLFNFSEAPNYVAQNANQLECWFDDGQEPINSYSYKLNRQTVDLKNNRILKSFRIPLNDHTARLSFGPFDVRIFKFVSDPGVQIDDKWQKVWSNHGNNFFDGIGPMRDNTKILSGDFDGDGADELMLISYTLGGNDDYLVMLKYINSKWEWYWSNNGDPSGGGGIYPYRNNLIVGDFDGDQKDDLLGLGNPGDPTDWITLFTFDLGTRNWNWSWSTGHNTNTHLLPGYTDKIYVGDFFGDGNDQLLACKINPNNINNESIVFQWDGSDFIRKSNYIAPGFNENLNKIAVGDFDGNGRVDIMKQDKLITVDYCIFYEWHVNYWREYWRSPQNNIGHNSWQLPFENTDIILSGNIDDTDPKDELMFIQNKLGGVDAKTFEFIDPSNDLDNNWASGLLHIGDWPVEKGFSSNTNYFLFRPIAGDPKYLFAIRKYCNQFLVSIYRPTSGFNFKVRHTSNDTDNTLVRLFPNPAENIITLLAKNVEIKSIEIFNGIGSKVLHQKCSGNQLSIDIGNLNSGLYHINVSLGNGIYESQSFLKENR